MASQRFHPGVIRALCAAVASAAAGYLLAVIFGNGIHGLKSGAALDNSTSFPDANVAFIAALLAYGASACIGAFSSRVDVERDVVFKWFAATAAVGAVVFGVSRLLV
jgi:hypothetical protein